MPVNFSSSFKGEQSNIVEDIRIATRPLTNEEIGVMVHVHRGISHDRQGNTQIEEDNTPNPRADEVMSRDVRRISGFSNEKGVGSLLARGS